MKMTKGNTIWTCLFLAGIISYGGFNSGCSTVSPGNDPLIVRTEQVEVETDATFTEFLTLDDIAQRNTSISNLWVDAHKFAQYLRQPIVNGTNTLPFGKATILSLDQVKLAYKAGTSTSNALVTAIATVEATANQANQYTNLFNLTH